MKPKVYVETSVISYLGAWPSRDLVTAAHQQITHDWWQGCASDHELFVSEAVLTEASGGDPDAAARRAKILEGITVLEDTDEATALAEEFVRRVPLPQKAAVDALHIALAVIHGMDYLLTWNCAHIANAMLRPRVEAVCRELGYQPPAICTPEELLGEENHVA